jgi:hypothetical protein
LGTGLLGVLTACSVRIELEHFSIRRDRERLSLAPAAKREPARHVLKLGSGE